MKYTISLYGKGNEMTIGSVKKETWDYIQEEFGGDESEYLEALDNGDVPEEHMLASESWTLYECDDLWHHDGCWSSWYRVEVEDEDGNVVFSFTNDNVEEMNIKTETEYASIDDDHKYIAVWSSVAKGRYLVGEFETEVFRPEGLKVRYSRISFNNDDEYDQIVSGFDYFGSEIDCEFDCTDGKGDSFRLIEVEQYPEDDV